MSDLRKQLEDLREECTSDDFRDMNGMLAAWWVVEKLDAILAEQGGQAPGLREELREALEMWERAWCSDVMDDPTRQPELYIALHRAALITVQILHPEQTGEGVRHE